MLVKIKDREDLVKDSKSGAVLLSDTGLRDDYKSRKNMMKVTHDLKEEINTIKQNLAELSSLKEDFKEIRELLQGIAKR